MDVLAMVKATPSMAGGGHRNPIINSIDERPSREVAIETL
jgi:hypothetical protein